METPSLSPENIVLQCPKCRSQLNVSRYVDRLDESCPICRSEISVTVFPRLFKVPKPVATTALSGEGDASCTFYPELQAEKVCDECGCFMSEKAAVRWGGGDYCLPCLHRLREERRATGFLARTKLYDRRALALVTLMAPFTLFTAPIALFLLIRYRRANTTFVPNAGGIWWTALILSIAWLAFWAVIIVAWLALVLEGFQ